MSVRRSLRVSALALLIVCSATAPLRAENHGGTSPNGPSRGTVAATPHPLLALLARLESSEKGDAKTIAKALHDNLSKAKALPENPSLLMGILLGSLRDQANKQKTLIEMLQRQPNDALAKQLLASDIFSQFTRQPKTLPSTPDKRTDIQATWVIKHAEPSGEDDDATTKKDHGLERVALDEKGKEILPPHSLLMKYDVATKKWALLVTDALAKPRPVLNGETAFLNGAYFGESPDMNLDLSNRNMADFPADFGPGSSDDFQKKPVLLTEFELNWRKRFPGDFGPPNAEIADIIKAGEARAKLPHPGGPLLPKLSPLSLTHIEDTLRIGAAASETMPVPLAHAWLDPSINSFLAVDEVKEVAYLQNQPPNGKLALSKLRLLDPVSLGFRREQVRDKHIVVARKQGEDSGIDYKVPGEDKLLKAWTVADERGQIFGLVEIKGEPTYRLVPIQDVVPLENSK